MYTIKRAAELIGVPVATLRAWERRYALVEPARTRSGYRLYDDAGIAVVRQMRMLVDQGWAPRQAAAEVGRPRAGEGQTQPGAGGAQEPPGTADPGHGGGGQLATGASTAAFVRAAATMDVIGVGDVLDEAFARGAFETVVDSWLMPALAELGRAWARGEVSIAGEHLASHAALRRLAGFYEAAGHNDTGERVVVGLPAGSRHELGLLAFAVAARRRGLAVLYLGADVPEVSWVEAAGRHAADAAVIGAPLAADASTASATVAGLRRHAAHVPVAVGGAAQDQVTGDVVRLGHGIATGVRQLLAVVDARGEQLR
jgi:methanogenic corrinoid protein MtbC1